MAASEVNQNRPSRFLWRWEKTDVWPAKKLGGSRRRRRVSQRRREKEEERWRAGTKATRKLRDQQTGCVHSSRPVEATSVNAIPHSLRYYFLPARLSFEKKTKKIWIQTAIAVRVTHRPHPIVAATALCHISFPSSILKTCPSSRWSRDAPATFTNSLMISIF